jgi:hypothetical protein
MTFPCTWWKTSFMRCICAWVFPVFMKTVHGAAMATGARRAGSAGKCPRPTRHDVGA